MLCTILLPLYGPPQAPLTVRTMQEQQIYEPMPERISTMHQLRAHVLAGSTAVERAAVKRRIAVDAWSSGS